ncbi:hypothetical protein Bpfe_029327 [Biomphalaria pfeifferi]|uniref:Uncharacterized protein n=1 Tax=Biomphalaria pfeifferi TaxID=112525 RepID=A0AAD8ARS9_BIOPF|nr:hypothetical protein Bpfe_029327 [Biomphalaria pfeifferi]
MCTAIIIDIGIEKKCQSSQAKSELARGRHLQLEETYLLDVRLLAAGDCGALDFVCNVASCEPAVSLGGVSQEGLLRQRFRSTAVLRKTVLDTVSFCVKRTHHRLNNSLVNWRKRKRHQRKTVQMTLWGTRFLTPVPPTDQPPLHSCSLLGRRQSGGSAETAFPINGCVEENSARHCLVLCQTDTSSSQQQPSQLAEEKAAPEENSANDFVGNTLPDACASHRSTSTALFLLGTKSSKKGAML